MPKMQVCYSVCFLLVLINSTKDYDIRNLFFKNESSGLHYPGKNALGHTRRTGIWVTVGHLGSEMSCLY